MGDAAAAHTQELKKRVAARVRALRLASGRTQEALAHDAGLAVRHLQKIESGEVNVTIGTLARLAVVLGVDASHLLRPVQ